jgi:hypothetical protein
MTEDTYSSAALEELIKLKHDNQKSDFWIGGDFNLPDRNWSSLTVTIPYSHCIFIKFTPLNTQKNQINATYSNISAISWRPVLVVEEARVPGENHRPWASNW